MAKPKHEKILFRDFKSPTVKPKSKVAKSIKKSKKRPKKKVSNRNAFNCKSCRGGGLVAQGTKDIICPICSGTGKV